MCSDVNCVEGKNTSGGEANGHSIVPPNVNDLKVGIVAPHKHDGCESWGVPSHANSWSKTSMILSLLAIEPPLKHWDKY